MSAKKKEETGKRLMAEELVPADKTIDDPEFIGRNVFIKTVTLYYTGEVQLVTPTEIVLTKAAWIPSTGRWANTCLQGLESIREVEPYAPEQVVHVTRASMVEYFEWPFDLPRDQKG